eukprot:364899-Chlamydomonas_euryale.AAC.44
MRETACAAWITPPITPGALTLRSRPQFMSKSMVVFLQHRAPDLCVEPLMVSALKRTAAYRVPICAGHAIYSNALIRWRVGSTHPQTPVDESTPHDRCEWAKQTLHAEAKRLTSEADQQHICQLILSALLGIIGKRHSLHHGIAKNLS